MRTGLLCCALSAALSAQQPDHGKQPNAPPELVETHELHITVVEAGTLAVIEGAQVQISWAGNDDPGVETPGKVTGPDGTLHAVVHRATNLFVSVTKAGYLISWTPVRVTASPVATEVSLSLERGGRLRGRVEDAETRDPLAAVPVELMRWGLEPVMLDAATQSDGGFEFAPSELGSFYVRVVPRLWSGRRFWTSFTEAEAALIDRDFEPELWPGGPGMRDVSPVQVTAGGLADVGTIRTRLVPFYRAIIRFPGAACEKGDTAEAKFSGESQFWVAPFAFPTDCGKDVLITGLLPGRYRVALSVQGSVKGQGVGHRALLSAAFEITDRNVDVAPPLLTGADLVGRVVESEGAGLPSAGAVSIGEMHGFGSREAKVDDRGRFLLSDAVPGRWYVGLADAPDGWFLREAKYQGVRLPMISPGRAVLDWDGAGTIEVVLDNQPGSVEGVVRGTGRVSEVGVLAVLWPPPPDGYASQNAGFEVTDQQGKFTMTGLPPGEYRLFVEPDGMTIIDGFDWTFLDMLAPRGKKVVVKRGESVQVEVPLISDPTK